MSDSTTPLSTPSTIKWRWANSSLYGLYCSPRRLPTSDGNLTSESSLPGLNIEKTHVWPRGSRSKEIRGNSKNVLGSNLEKKDEIFLKNCEIL